MLAAAVVTNIGMILLSNPERRRICPGRRCIDSVSTEEFSRILKRECGSGEVDEDVKNDIAVAKRLNITAATLDGILAVNQQGLRDV